MIFVQECEICHQDVEIKGLDHVKMDSSYRCEYFCKGCVPKAEKPEERDKCVDCGSIIGLNVRFGCMVTEGKKNIYICSTCNSKPTYVPDVYWDGKPEENLADDPVTGQPRIFSCKTEKANYLKEKGLMEAGDSVHGAPATFAQNQNRKPFNNKDEVKKVLQFVKNMGKDYRRQQVLKIMKENQKYAQG